MELKEIQEKVYREYIKNGYLEEWTVKPTFGRTVTYDTGEKMQKKVDLCELGLITTEIAEAMEEIRNKETDYNHLSIECADIIIRTLNFMSRKGISAEFWILEKDKKNNEREKLHGRGV